VDLRSVILARRCEADRARTALKSFAPILPHLASLPLVQAEREDDERRQLRGVAERSRARLSGDRLEKGHEHVESSSEQLRVLRIKYGPGEKSVMHGHPALVGVLLTDGTVRFTYPDANK
jgi:hypothetical protein